MAGKVSMPRWLLVMGVITLVAALGFGAWGVWSIISPQGIGEQAAAAQDAEEAEHKDIKYTCSMHPQILEDEPGDCPICGMTLVPVEMGTSTQTEQDQTTSTPKTVTKYTCAMHPQILEDEPGDCPICGMTLVPTEIEIGGGEPDEHSEHADPPGYTTVRISSERRQLIGVKTGLVRTIDLTKTIRTVGLVTVDESRVAHIHSKIQGWIEEAMVKVTWELVTKGEPLLSIYSPELVSAQEEYLMALRARERISDSKVREIMTGGANLVEITRKRLELWDITDHEIELLEKEGKPRKTMVLYAPFTGFITSTKAIDGMYITPMTELYTIVDLSTVWVMADIYEFELPFVREGQEAQMTLSYLPDRVFKGRVDYIYPTLSSKTRTAKVRFVFPNPNLELKLEMYVNLELSRNLGSKLAVPEGAILDTGEMQVVFVDLGDGRLQPRHVKVGPNVNGAVIILEGLSEGERVVTSANFLIDSESRTKAALEAIGKSASGQHQH